MTAFPLKDQNDAIKALSDRLPDNTSAIVVFVTEAPEHGEGSAYISCLATLPRDSVIKALSEVLLRQMRGDAPEPVELNFQ